jgi:hypothetical protein
VRQVVLYIKDNSGNYQLTEMFKDETITITSKLQDVRDISKVFTDFSQPFTIPASKENNKILQHWYNFNIDVEYDSEGVIQTGFDNRVKRDALLELDYAPYKAGKIDLESVNMRNGKPFSYTLIFYGNTVSLKTLMGDDKLNTLNYLDDNYNHDYNATDIRTAVRNGLFSQSNNVPAIIYPLISHTKRFYYDSENSLPQFSGNLYHNSSNPSDNQGLAWTDVKPAVTCLNVIEAIESKYNITFTRDFFGATAFSNLYIWLSRNKGPIGGDDDDGVLKTRILGDWSRTSGYTGFTVSSTVWSFSLVKNTNTFTGDLDVTVDTADSSKVYTLKALDLENGSVVSEITGLTGDQTLSVAFLNTNSHQIRFVMESTESISFSATLEIEEQIFSTSTTNTAVYSTGSISSTEQIIITENTPDIKNIDFLTGIFKMFNLTAYFIDDISDPDYGKIYVDTLDNFYLTGNYYDVSADIDVKTSDINAPTNYSGIDFVYEEPSTLVSINHEEQFNDVFGDAHVRRTNIDKTEIYKVEAPFEHIKYERIIDTNKTSTSPYSTIVSPTPYITDIQWGYSADGEFNGTFTPKVQGAATNTLSNKLKDTNQEFNNKVEVGDVVRNLTDNTSAKVTVVDSADTLSLSSDIMASGESYMILGDYTELGNYEPVLCKPLIFYGIRESMGSTKRINWISGGSAGLSFYYRPSNTNVEGATTVPPAYTINFDNEVDEWNLTDYSNLTPPQSTNSLFKKFYEDYVEDLFDVKKRIFKVKAHLSMEVIINLKLNDTLIINNQAFKINSITTNLQTEMSELELLNVVNNYLPLSLSLDNVYQTLGIYYTYYYSNSIGIASNLSNGDIIYTDSNLTNTLSAGTYYQGGGTESTRVCDFGGSITVNSVGQITSIDCAQP